MLNSMFPDLFQRDPIDNTPLSWTAHPDNIPIRLGDAPNLIPKELLDRATTKIAGVRSKILKIPEQLEEYTNILTWITTGAAILRFEERRPDPNDAAKWAVWICWVEVRGVIPKPSGRV